MAGQDSFLDLHQRLRDGDGAAGGEIFVRYRERLIRLLGLNDLYLTASTDDEKVTIDDALRPELDELAQAAGRADFRAWVGAENYEMRVAEDFSWLDQRVLEILRSS